MSSQRDLAISDVAEARTEAPMIDVAVNVALLLLDDRPFEPIESFAELAEGVVAVSDFVKDEANPRALARPLAGAFLGRSECALEAAERVRDAALSDERDPLCQKLIG